MNPRKKRNHERQRIEGEIEDELPPGMTETPDNGCLCTKHVVENNCHGQEQTGHAEQNRIPFFTQIVADVLHNGFHVTPSCEDGWKIDKCCN